MEPQKKKINEREIRFADIILREEPTSEQPEGEEQPEDSGYYELVGTPIVFNQKTKLGNFDEMEIYEVMEPDCFDDADISDVVFNVNHGDGNHATARTRNGTLKLTKKEDGVECLVKLDKKNPRCVQTYIDVKSGLLDKMSFAFTIDEEEFDRKESCYHVKKLGKIYDVSAVEHPAYSETSISARRAESAVVEEAKAVALKIETEKEDLIRQINESLGKEKVEND